MYNESGDLSPVIQPQDPKPVPWEPETPVKPESPPEDAQEDSNTIKLPEIPGITPSA